MKKYILPSLLTLSLTAVVSYFLIEFLMNYKVAEEVETTIDTSSIVKFVVTSFIYFFMLINIPAMSKDIIRWFHLHPSQLWRIIVAFEAFGFAYAFLATPPDLISTILAFMFWQLIVLVNSICARRCARTVEGGTEALAAQLWGRRSSGSPGRYSRSPRRH